MVRSLSPEQLRRARLRANRLAFRDADVDVEVADVVEAVVGLQAQDEFQATLGVRARSRDPTAEDVGAALYDEHTVVRTWCMRGTLHLVAATDVPWLLSLFGPLYVARGRRRLDELGFDDETADWSVAVIVDTLTEDGPQTRSDIAAALNRAAIDVDPKNQGPIHLIRRAAMLGEVCQVATDGRDPVYGPLDAEVPNVESLDRTTALADLVRRYLDGYGPATVADFASWSGLLVADAREGWERVAGEDGDAEAVLIDGDPGLAYQDHADVDLDSPASLRLLPAYDAYILGYDGRDHVLPPDYAKRVHPGGGIIRPTVVDDGRAVATWSLDRSRTTPLLSVDPFESLSEEAGNALEEEAADVGRFLGVELRLGE